MSRDKKPICFIAMAFGRIDTDNLYDKQILPILKANEIQPIRIDRRESNDDLNNQIIEQLRSSDFCITDLTYARQSVYFEAGFAQRSIPVIYTVRKDHLESGQPDNKRVHFDLQMKPIIVWKDPDDPAFSTNLLNRIKSTFLNNWKRVTNTDAKQSESIIEFGNKGLRERMLILRRKTILALRHYGFISSNWFAPGYFNNIRGKGYNSYRNAYHVSKAQYRHLCAYKMSNNHEVTFVTVQAYDTITQGSIQDIKDYYYFKHYQVNHEDHLNALYINESRNMAFIHILLSLKNISSQRIESCLPYAKPIEKGRCYKEVVPIRYYSYQIKVPTSWHFLAGIESELELTEILRKELSKFFNSSS